jgi:1-deoxy-D-xylulose-5-phosphate reductoisomerase
VVVGTSGIVSLRPVLAALRARKVVATANKETLVAGGHLVMPLAHALAERASADGSGGSMATGSSPAGSSPAGSSPAGSMATPLAWLRPIDSEHSAIWQCLVGESRSDVERLILTASGGPFLDWTPERLRSATPADALRHPTWSMGAKITVDSATMMNKGLEVIEARWLYDVPYDRISVTIHPQSIVHSLVEFVDGSLKAQLGLPDMRIPIQYALTYPRRRPSPAPRLDLSAQPDLGFRRPDEGIFPALRVARDAALAGPRATATLIAADEVAVARFLAGSLGFLGITALAEHAVERFGSGPAPGLDELIDLDRHVRAWSATAAVAPGS